MVLKDYCLPSGPYQFDISTPCDTFTLRKNLQFPDVYSTRMVEQPEFYSERYCTDSYISYTSGKFVRESRNTSLDSGLLLTPVIDTMHTYYQFISGPVGGYDSKYYEVGDSMRISMPGDYVVRVFPSTSLLFCSLPAYYDTIHYGSPTVEFVYAYAYLCDSSSTQGTAYVKATNGTPPYTYILYDSPDKQGNVIDTIVIADSTQAAIFPDKAMTATQELSCFVIDACGSYFHVNFFPNTMAEMQKIWFDGGLTEMSVCEGTTVQVHALDLASILKYEWYNPNKELIDSVSSPEIFIPRGAQEGWYSVLILNSGCVDTLVDSVRLTVKPSPEISLSQSDTVCPGEPVQLTFTPTSPNYADLTFTIAFENSDSVETRTYSTPSGVAVTDTYITYTDAKVYPLSVNDGNCDYTIADDNDTLYIKMKTNLADACTLIGSFDTVCYGGDALFAARSTMEKPYTIRWYSDYELTHLLYEETMTATGRDTSFYDTLGLTHHAEVFVTVEKDGYCPTVYGMPTQTVNFSAGATALTCGKVVRLYDDGGPSNPYTIGTNVRHTYTTTDGRPVTIHFDELDLSGTSHLFVISGTVLNTDSVLYDLTAGSPNPGMITTHGNTLTLYFVPGMMEAGGWSAIVEHIPGMSVADVWKKNEVVIRDEVCQSQTNSYDDPYDVVPDVVASISTLNTNMRKAGTYSYTKTLPGADVRGCDSTVTFILTVNPPPHHDTTVVTTNLLGGSYTWSVDGNTYTATGRYSKQTTLPDGCDSLDILDFIILQVDTSNNEICRDDTTRIGVTVTTPDISFHDNLIPPTIAVGHVLCDDGSILTVDSFLTSGKIAKGLIFYVDSTGVHGLAVSLSEDQYAWSPTLNQQWTPRFAGSLSVYNASDYYKHPIFATNGMENTLSIKEHTEALSTGFQTNAPAAYYCYYYDHVTMTVGTEHKGWYMPAIGELNLLCGLRPVLNVSLEKLNAVDGRVKTISTNTYKSSSESSNDYNYNRESATMTTANKYHVQFVRPIIAF